MPGGDDSSEEFVEDDSGGEEEEEEEVGGDSSASYESEEESEVRTLFQNEAAAREGERSAVSVLDLSAEHPPQQTKRVHITPVGYGVDVGSHRAEREWRACLRSTNTSTPPH